MAFESALVNQGFNSTASTIDFTKSGFGAPDAVIFFAVSTTLNSGRATADHYNMIGLWDGTRLKSVCVWDEDAEATSDSQVAASSDRLVLTGRFAGTSLHTVSAITDGIRLTLDGSSGIGQTSVAALLIKGTSAVRVDTFTPDATATNTVSVTTPGFQPDYIMFVSPGGTAFSTGSGTALDTGQCAVAHVARDGAGFNAISSSWGSLDNVGTTDIKASMTSDSHIAQTIFTNQQELSFVSFDTTGFTVRSDSSRAGNRDVMYIAIKLSATDKAVTFSDSAGITTGNKTYTTTNVNPDTILTFVTRLENGEIGGPVVTDQNAEMFCFYLCDSADSEATIGGGSEDAVLTSRTIEVSDTNQFILYRPDASGAVATADIFSKGTEQFVMNWTDASPSPARAFAGVAIGADANPSGTPAYILGKFTYRGIEIGIERGMTR